ncbi:MAG: hypothetical protein HY558_01310 [Euryarchaeota archaeon]|nr:hypothetical protein [Euryarchaeota archaeon]
MADSGGSSPPPAGGGPPSGPEIVAGLVAGLAGAGVGFGLFYSVAGERMADLLVGSGAFVGGGVAYGALYHRVLEGMILGKNAVQKSLLALLSGWAIFFALPISIGAPPPGNIPVVSNVLGLFAATRPASILYTAAIMVVAAVVFGVLCDRRKG